jgi:hypothetical protein
MIVDRDDLIAELEENETPTWKQQQNMIPEIKKAYKEFRSLLWKARFGGDGSFGLDQAQDRLDESYMWALKELKGADNKDF